MDKPDETRKEKQEFLKKSILEKGIAPKRFTQYLQHAKNEALDIDNWTIDELSRVVDQFHREEELMSTNKILTDTNSHTPFRKIETQPIEYIEVVGETHKRRLVMLSKKVYEIKSSLITGSVFRSYSDIKWLNEVLKDEFPGLMLPVFPERKRESINKYFKSLLLLKPLLTNYTLNVFISCVSDKSFSEFLSKKTVKKQGVLQQNVEKEPLNFFGRFSISRKEMDQLVTQAKDLDDIPTVTNSDFPQFAQKMNEMNENNLIIYKELNRVLKDISKQLFELNRNFNHAADLFSNLALNARKLNAAKEQFPDPNLNSIDLEQVYSKYKLLFFNTGRVKRTCVHSSGKVIGES